MVRYYVDLPAGTIRILRSNRLRVFVLGQLEGDHAHRETHAGADLYRQAVRVVSQPYEHVGFAWIKNAVEQENLVADGIEGSRLDLHLFTILRFHADIGSLLSVAHGRLFALARLQLVQAQLVQPGHDIHGASRNIDFRRLDHGVLV